jgi:hypothetical protein
MITGNYEHLRDNLKGETVFIVGSGISLIGYDFNPLKGQNVIALNHAYQDVEFKHHVFLDTRFLQEAGFHDETGFRLDKMPWSKITSSHSTLAPRENLAVIKPVNHFSYDPKIGFYTNKNSACFALSCAIFMGAKDIFLLGIDCRFAEKEEAVFIARQNGNEKKANEIMNSSLMIYGHSSTGRYNHSKDKKEHEGIFKGFANLFDVFDGKANIYNCSQWSRIKTFPFADMP